MTITVIKAEKVLFAGLGALEREVVLPSLVWRDAFGDFKGAEGDTITVKVPAVTSARSRALRSGSTRTRDSLKEGKVAVTLDTNLYKDVQITDEEMTLDIREFGAQVMSPIVNAMVRGYEEEIVDLMEDNDPEVTVPWEDDDPHSTLVDAGTALSNANVPLSGRVVALGTELAARFVKADQARRADSAGDGANAALRDATIATPYAGFGRIVVVPALHPTVGYAFHRTAYVLSSVAPVVPAGVAWGASVSSGGFALRAIRQFDPSPGSWVDILGFDAYAGTNVVEDAGAFDAYGKFQPAETPADDNSDKLFVRAVRIGDSSSS